MSDCNYEIVITQMPPSESGFFGLTRAEPRWPRALAMHRRHRAEQEPETEVVAARFSPNTSSQKGILRLNHLASCSHSLFRYIYCNGSFGVDGGLRRADILNSRTIEVPPISLPPGKQWYLHGSYGHGHGSTDSNLKIHEGTEQETYARDERPSSLLLPCTTFTVEL